MANSRQDKLLVNVANHLCRCKYGFLCTLSVNKFGGGQPCQLAVTFFCSSVPYQVRESRYATATKGGRKIRRDSARIGDSLEGQH